MRRERWIQIGALASMLAFLGAGGFLATGIAASVGRNRLVYSDTAESSDPPQVALGIAMGAFRGLFVNYLWIRANDLKEQGKYFEAVDLARTITRLQPRFPRVWQFHAWNLAYNISVATQTPEERWNWVQAGIRLLRDEGIPANPTDVYLHKELAWIHLHKIQGYMDDAHLYYKSQFAREWTVVLGPPPTLTLEQQGRPDEARRAFIDRWLRPIADAPDTLEELYRTPGTRDLIDSFRRLGYSLDEKLLEQYALIRSAKDAQAVLNFQAAGILESPLAAIFTDARLAGAGRAVLHYARKRLLIDTYHMEPARMLAYMERYGPLDWRHAAAHAVYWSVRGSGEALLRMTTANEGDYDLLNNDRLTVQAVQDLFRTGTVSYTIINPDFYMAMPNTAFIDTYKSILFDLRGRSKFDSTGRPYGMYSAGYENFMRDAIRYLFRRGDLEAAERYRKELIDYPELNTNNPDLYISLSRPLAEFVVSEIRENDRETNPTVALQEVEASLLSAYINGLLAGNDKAFRAEFDYARTFHAVYQQTQSFRVWVAGAQGRLGFPPFEAMSASILADVIARAGLPQGPLIFARAPVDLRARAYVLLERAGLTGDPNQPGAEERRAAFNMWYPEPPGVEMYRAQMGQPGDVVEKGRMELK